MLDLADGWGHSCPEPVIDITDDVLESWGASPAHTLPRPAPTTPLPAVVPAQASPAGDDSAPAPQPSLAEQSPAAGPVPAQQSAQVISIKSRRPRAQGLEETVLAWLLASRPERFPRRIDLVEAMEAAGVGSRSGLQAAIRRMVEASPAQLIQEHGRLAPVLRWHEGCMDELHAVDAAEASR